MKSMNYAFGFNGPDIEEVYHLLSDGSIGSGALEKRRNMLTAYVQAYAEEIGIEFAERIYAFLEEK